MSIAPWEMRLKRRLTGETVQGSACFGSGGTLAYQSGGDGQVAVWGVFRGWEKGMKTGKGAVPAGKRRATPSEAPGTR